MAARVLGPGCWVDKEGGFHIAIPEVLDYLGMKDTPENEEEIRLVVGELIREQVPNAEVIHTDACPGCGLRGGGGHSTDCWYVA